MTGSNDGSAAARMTDPVVLVGLALVAAQVAVRAWASSDGWFSATTTT